MYQLLILFATAQAPLLSKPLENGINDKLSLIRTLFCKLRIALDLATC